MKQLFYYDFTINHETTENLHGKDIYLIVTKFDDNRISGKEIRKVTYFDSYKAEMETLNNRINEGDVGAAKECLDNIKKLNDPGDMDVNRYYVYDEEGKYYSQKKLMGEERDEDGEIKEMYSWFKL